MKRRGKTEGRICMNASTALKIARNGYIVMAVIFCGLGIFLMADPAGAMKVICVIAGLLFIADGIIKIIGYFSRDFYCLAFQFDLGFGILMIAMGILILVKKGIHSQADLCNLWTADSGRCIASDSDVGRGKKIWFKSLVGNSYCCNCNRNLRDDSSHRSGRRCEADCNIHRNRFPSGGNPETVCSDLYG